VSDEECWGGIGRLGEESGWLVRDEEGSRRDQENWEENRIRRIGEESGGLGKDQESCGEIRRAGEGTGGSERG